MNTAVFEIAPLELLEDGGLKQYNLCSFLNSLLGFWKPVSAMKYPEITFCA